MNKQDKIDRIYKEIAQDRTVSIYEEGCTYEIDDVMIGDVLDHIDFDESLQPDDIYDVWEKLRKPIEEQSEATIDYIYNLITNE